MVLQARAKEGAGDHSGPFSLAAALQTRCAADQAAIAGFSLMFDGGKMFFPAFLAHGAGEERVSGNVGFVDMDFATSTSCNTSFHFALDAPLEVFSVH